MGIEERRNVAGLSRAPERIRTSTTYSGHKGLNHAQSRCCPMRAFAALSSEIWRIQTGLSYPTRAGVEPMHASQAGAGQADNHAGEAATSICRRSHDSIWFSGAAPTSRSSSLPSRINTSSGIP